MSNGKAVITRLRTGLTKKILLYKIIYYPEPNTSSKNKKAVELNFSNYATKSDFKKYNRCWYIRFC